MKKTTLSSISPTVYDHQFLQELELSFEEPDKVPFNLYDEMDKKLNCEVPDKKDDSLSKHQFVKPDITAQSTKQDLNTSRDSEFDFIILEW